MTATLFVNKAGTFGDHPTCNANRRLQTQGHKDVVSNKLAFNNLSKWWTDVWKRLEEATLSKEISVTATNCFVIKSFFRITWLLIKKNRAHSYNFKSIVEVVAACGREEIQKHLLHAPRKANYMSHEYISKYIQIIDDHIKLPLLASLRTSGPFTFFNNETSQISNFTMSEQMTIYATFNYQGTIKEHYVGIIPISKLVGTELSAPNIMKALIKVFDKINILITQARFSCMDNTNVNSGSHGGLKKYILHKMMALWVGCGNHKLALCFEPLLKEFPCVAEFDATLLSLWKHFHYQPLAVNFLQEFAEAYNGNQVLPVCPSTTRWTSHGRACKALYEGYQAQIGALTMCYNERKEPKALGIFMAVTLEIFIASLLMLWDVFKAIAPLNLVLQTVNEQLCLTDVKTYVHLTRSKLENLRAGETKWFKEENFDDMVRKAQQQTLSLPPSARLRSADTSFGWEHYVTDVFEKFLSAFIVQLDDAFE